MNSIKCQIIVRHLISNVIYCGSVNECSEEDLDDLKGLLNKAAAKELRYLAFEGESDGHTHIIPDTILQQSVITLRVIKE